MQEQGGEMEYSSQVEDLTLEKSMDRSFVIIGGSGLSAGGLVRGSDGTVSFFLKKQGHLLRVRWRKQ